MLAAFCSKDRSSQLRDPSSVDVDFSRPRLERHGHSLVKYFSEKLLGMISARRQLTDVSHGFFLSVANRSEHPFFAVLLRFNAEPFDRYVVQIDQNDVEVISRTLKQITGRDKLLVPVDDLRGF